MKILFVWTGNTCRSPMAQVIAQREIDKHEYTGLEVASAGTNAQDKATDLAIAVAKEHELNLSDHQARQLTSNCADWADLVVGMEQVQVDCARQLGAERAIKLRKDDVPDPMIRNTYEAYCETWDVLEQEIPNLLARYVS